MNWHRTCVSFSRMKKTTNIFGTTYTADNKHPNGFLKYDAHEYRYLSSVMTAIHRETLNTFPMATDGTVDINAKPIPLGERTQTWLAGLSDWDVKQVTRIDGAQAAVFHGCRKP